MLACTAGELIGIGIATSAALVVTAVVGEPQTPAARFGMLALFAGVGAIEGGALAGFQWRVLRTRLPRLGAAEWIGVTIALAVAGWLVGMTPPLFFAGSDTTAPASEPPLAKVLLYAALAGAAAGLCFGAAQWFVLRRHAERAGRWIGIHVPAWALAMAAIFLGASLPTAEWPGWVIGLVGAAGGLLGGVLLGAVTGLVARRLRPWVDEERWSLRGKVCAVTGATSGIGREVARGLARLGGTVVLICRRAAEGEHVRAALVAARPGADVHVVGCDLADFVSIRAAADELRRLWPRLDVLVHNAGATFPARTITADGVEATLAVDVVGPFLLTALLRERLEASQARVVTLTGIYQRKGQVDLEDLHFTRRPYDWLAANNQAQRGRLLFTTELARRAPRITATSVHPGAVLTGAQARLPRLLRALIHTLMRPGFVRAEVGAIPVLRLAAHPDPGPVTGRFFDRCRLAPDRQDPMLASAFWLSCERMCGDPWSGRSNQRRAG